MAVRRFLGHRQVSLAGHRQRTVHIRNCIVVCHVFAVSIQNTRIARHVVARAHQRLAAGHSHDCSVTRDKTCVGVAVVGQRRAVINLAVAVSGDGDGTRCDGELALHRVHAVVRVGGVARDQDVVVHAHVVLRGVGADVGDGAQVGGVDQAFNRAGERRVCFAIGLAGVGNLDGNGLAADRQCAFCLDDGVVVQVSARLRGVAERVGTATHLSLRSRERVGGAVIADPACLTQQTVGVLTRHVFVRNG